MNDEIGNRRVRFEDFLSYFKNGKRLNDACCPASFVYVANAAMARCDDNCFGLLHMNNKEV